MFSAQTHGMTNQSKFDDNDYLHYSYCVDREFDKKYKGFLKEQKKLFYSLRDELNLIQTIERKINLCIFFSRILVEISLKNYAK